MSGTSQGGSLGCPRGRGRAQGGGRPPTLVGSLGLFWPNSFTPWPSSGPKISSVKFQVNWNPFYFPFFVELQKQGKTETGTGL